MIDIHSWLEIFSGHLEAEFPGRIWFVGLQGSYARGEAKDTSDIDVVVIFDKLSVNDLESFRNMLDDIPERGKICGFVSGRDEIMSWESSDLFQFFYDTLPITGSLDELLPLIDRDAVKRAVKTGACNIYHACVHNFLHEKSPDILKGVCKSAAFVIQAEYFLKTGRYIRKHSELCSLVPEDEQKILACAELGFDGLSRILFTWAGRIITNDRL